MRASVLFANFISFSLVVKLSVALSGRGPRTGRKKIAVRNAAEVEEVTILKGGSVMVQSLPAQYVLSMDHSVIDYEGSNLSLCSISGLSEDDLLQGWVNPHSFSQLWTPVDLLDTEITSRLSIGALVKDGQLRSVFPGFDTSVKRNGLSWRNWGMNSVPIASAWLDIGLIPLQSLKLSAYLSAGDDNLSANWIPLLENIKIEDALAKLYEVVADPPEQLLKPGFQLVHVPLPDAIVEVPRDGEKIRLYLTDYPEPAKLLELPGDASGAGFLEFTSMQVASGAKSENMPATYTPLYH